MSETSVSAETRSHGHGDNNAGDPTVVNKLVSAANGKLTVSADGI